jgi:hypothetical protein
MDEGATGDIWSTGAFSFESPLKDLLDRGDYTLEELLAEDELLQELRGMHPQLIQFFSTEDAVEGLIKYVIRMETTETMTNGSTPEIEAPDDENNATKKPGQWLFPPMEQPAKSPKKSAEEEEELLTVRYPYMACEVICCEISSIIDILVDGRVATDANHVRAGSQNHIEVTSGDDSPILDLLFSLLDRPVGKLDDYRAGYLDKILSVLFRKRPKSMSSYMNDAGVALMEKMMKHLYSHSIMQIVQRLLIMPPRMGDEDSNGEYDSDEYFIFRCRWSELPEAIDLLRGSLINLDTALENQSDVQLAKSQNASEVLITVIQNSPLTSPTLLALTTEPIMGRIVKAACTLDGADFSPHDSSLTCAMNVFESLVLQLGGYGSVGTATSEEEEASGNANGEEDDASLNLGEEKSELKPRPDKANANELIRHLPELLRELCSLLRHPSTKTWISPMQFSKSKQEPLLGMSRLRIVRLIESLVLLGNQKVDTLLCESDCLKICLDLFWEFQWCSMLHQSVANLLVHVFEGANERADLQEYFLVKCNLLGRLMDSFDDDRDEAIVDNLLSDAVMAIQTMHKANRSLSMESTRGSLCNIGAILGDDDDIPVSDDDVDAALEHQAAVTDLEGEDQETKAETAEQKSDFVAGVAVTDETTDVSNDDVKSHIPSLRMGCLGHVIIICQALVHACTNDMQAESHEESHEEDTNECSDMMRSVDLGASNGANGMESSPSEDKSEKEDKSEPPSSGPAEPIEEQDDIADVQTDTSDSQGTMSNDLVIAQLVNSHPLQARWSEFITTTLASETAIQSTPLGGTNAAAIDPMNSQVLNVNVARSTRTYDFSDDDGEDVSGGNARGFLGGEVLDMDDNDLDIAASMMEALTLSRPRGTHTPGDRDVHNGDDSSALRHDAAISSFGTVIPNSGATTGDYIFDDPLGDNSRFNAFGQDDSLDEDQAEECGSDLAGEGDGMMLEKFGPDEEDEAPVMDLFAGNFDPTPSNTENGTWSNFANFDDAFAAASSIDTTIFGSGSSDENDVVQMNPGSSSHAFESDEKSVEDLFGSMPHALLLGDDDADDSGRVETADEETSDSPDVPEVGEAVTISALKQEAESALPDIPFKNPSEEIAAEMLGNEPKLESAVSG